MDSKTIWTFEKRKIKQKSEWLIQKKNKFAFHITFFGNFYKNLWRFFFMEVQLKSCRDKMTKWHRALIFWDIEVKIAMKGLRTYSECIKNFGKTNTMKYKGGERNGEE